MKKKTKQETSKFVHLPAEHGHTMARHQGQFIAWLFYKDLVATLMSTARFPGRNECLLLEYQILVVKKFVISDRRLYERWYRTIQLNS